MYHAFLVLVHSSQAQLRERNEVERSLHSITPRCGRCRSRVALIASSLEVVERKPPKPGAGAIEGAEWARRML
jgi:hypothetical protein